MSRARNLANLLDSNGDVLADSLDNVPAQEVFASGTSMLFQQTAAPTGWTKQTTHNDKALRIVTGTVGTGGSVGFASAMGTPSVSGSVSISGAPSKGNLAGNTTVNGNPSVSGNINKETTCRRIIS